MHRILLGILLTATFAFSQSGISTPSAGLLRDSSGALRAVFGIRGNFFLGPQWMEGALAASYSGSFAVVKSEDGVFVFDSGMGLVASQSVGGSDALFAFSGDGSPLVAYIPDLGVMYRWCGNSFHQLDWPAGWLQGRPLAIAAADDGAVAVVVEREDSVWLVKLALDNGRILYQAMLPGISGPVYLQHDGTFVYPTEETNELVLRWRGEFEQRMPVSGEVTGFERIGRYWIRVLGEPGSADLALRLEQGHAALYRLPGGNR